jgi:hypothetical protein
MKKDNSQTSSHDLLMVDLDPLSPTVELETPTEVLDFNDLDLDFLEREVARERTKKGGRAKVKNVPEFPRGYFRCEANYNTGHFQVVRVCQEEYEASNKAQEGYFKSWNQIRHHYCTRARERRKLNMQVIKKVMNCHSEVLKKGRTE